MTFRLGCCLVQYNFAGYEFEDALKSIHSIGFEGVETYVPPKVLAEGRNQLGKLLAKYELEPVRFALGGYGIESGVGKLAVSDAAAVKSNEKNYRKNILIAQDNGFSSIVMFTGPLP